MILLSVLIGPLLIWFKTNMLKGIENATLTGNILVSVLTAAVFMSIMAAAAYGLKINEITDVAGQFADKIKKTFGFQ